MTSRNGTRRAGDILPREAARVAAAEAGQELLAQLKAAKKAAPASRFAHLAEAHYWADAVAALAAYDRMFERNP